MARQLDAQSRIDTFSCGTITHTAPELMDEVLFLVRFAFGYCLPSSSKQSDGTQLRTLSRWQHY